MNPMVCIVPNQRFPFIHINEHHGCVIDANTMQQASSNDISFSFLPWRKGTQNKNNKLSQAKKLGK
jgi:hypothetical protein